MGRPDTITMSMQELDRCKVIEAVVRDGLMVWRAAEKLGISRRQIERLAQRYREDGPRGLLSRKWGQAGHRQLPPGLESRARGLTRDRYAEFGPALAAEILCERHAMLRATERERLHPTCRKSTPYAAADRPSIPDAGTGCTSEHGVFVLSHLIVIVAALCLQRGHCGGAIFSEGERP